ncbi:MAG: hypothetical protein ISN64_01920, partial [Rickettsia sp.]|nr:hypothetical protein [Rickettsia sp.]
MNIHLVFV